MCMMELQRDAKDMICDITGKPITITNEHGMYCSEMCGEEADAQSASDSRKKVNSLIDSIEW